MAITQDRRNIYSDLDISFTRNPLTRDVARVTDERAIAQSLRNLVFTNFNERRFHPEIGSNIRALLFENFSPITTSNIRQAIQEIANNYEPRVIIDDIVIVERPEQNSYGVKIVYRINNIERVQTLDLVLERLR